MALDDSKAGPSLEETAITLFCWWEAFSTSPYVIRTMFSPLMPHCIKAWLLSWKHTPDFLVLWGFAVPSIYIVPKFLLRHQNTKNPESASTGIETSSGTRPVIVVTTNANKENARRAEIIKKVMRQQRTARIIRILRSFGLVLVKERILDGMNVATYGTFRRPPTWPESPNRNHNVDRINFNDNRGVEYQYSKDHVNLIVREHPADNETYGQEIVRRPTGNDVKLLIFASNYFPFWGLVHLFKRPFLPARNS